MKKIIILFLFITSCAAPSLDKRVDYIYQLNNNKFNEFGDATIDSTNTYQGGGTAFKTSTAVEELSATLGLGYSYGSDSTSIEFAYEADVNDDSYLSHYGSIKLVGKF